jgi:hypothetical protein
MVALAVDWGTGMPVLAVDWGAGMPVLAGVALLVLTGEGTCRAPAVFTGGGADAA